MEITNRQRLMQSPAYWLQNVQLDLFSIAFDKMLGRGVNALVAAKAKLTKRRQAIEAYIASQQGNMFFDPASDENLLKAQAKLKRAEADVAAAHERMKTKFNNISKKQ